MAGALTPLFVSYSEIGMYRFMDSTGAEYRLTQTAPNSGEWVSKDGLFITYKSAEGRLYFPDGSWWHFGSIAGSSEMDLGTRYPTLFQDRNGNQIKVRYRPARGGTQINGSGRIWRVEDVRQVVAGWATYECSYVNDSLQHLNSCVTMGNLKTGENYQVGIGAASPLTDPFLGQSFGDKQVLNGITNISDGINAPFYFGYDNGASSGPGELTAAVFPYGGALNWGYGTGTLAGGRQFRKVATRAYNANDGQGNRTSQLHFYPGANAQLPVHDWTVLQDPSLTADKAWWWEATLGSPVMGLNRHQADRKMPSFAAVAERAIGWSLTTNGNPFIANVTETMDPGHADAKIRRTEQAINDYGNITSRREFAFGPTGVIAREFTYNYVTANDYINRHIRNLVSSVVLSRPGSSVTVAQNSYDQYVTPLCSVGGLAAMPNATLHDTVNYGPFQHTRGNLTHVTSLGKTRCFGYNLGGAVRLATDTHGHTVSMTLDQAKNYAVPSAITSAGLTSSPSFDAALNLTQNSGPNGATATFGWDGVKRQTSQTLPSGQVINHTYGLGQGPGASWHQVTTGIAPNLRWTRTVFDGFGRTLEVISGFRVGATDTSVSRVKTEYAPCACSSIGKVKRVSMPYAANGSPTHWTTYDYDEIGRTVRVTPPGNAGFTSYEYGGTTVKTIDPKGKWKKFVNDSLGNLVTVLEPRPGGGADYETSYTYTILGKLHKVTMQRPGKGLNAPPTVTQVRTFTYNGNGQLTSIEHPENGTTQYEYFGDGSPKKKTDAKGQRVEWTYTPEGRPEIVKKFWANGTEDTSSRVTYQYGGQTIDPGFAGANLQGRVAAATTGGEYSEHHRGGRIDELYSYNVAGAVVIKRVRITRGSSTVTKDIVYTYDGEGKLASTKYPDEAKPWVMGYDAMARPNGMTQEWWDGNNSQWVNRQWVNGVSYGVAGQLMGISVFAGINIFNGGEFRFAETREYNERLQMTRQRTLHGSTVAMDLKYVFNFPNDMDPAKKLNDGRIRQRENVVSGETVSYTYDSLQRLVAAETTSAAWGLSWDYDGFGNRWEQDLTKGTGPENSVTFNQTTNRINSSLYSHDANGNMLSTPTVSGMTYDVENRLLTASGNGSVEEFAYLGDNKRVWKKANQNGTPVEQYYLYGVGGQRIATYSASITSGALTLNYESKDVYFGGRVIWQNGKAVVQDRLGSVMARDNGVGTVETHDYFPYGEERTATVGDRNKFGTYHRDQTGLDYADQRYYNSAIGRFLTSDPYEASGGAGEPGSWGRGGYVGGDPVNYGDPSGLARCFVAGASDGYARVNCQSDDGLIADWFLVEAPNPPGLPLYANDPWLLKIQAEAAATWVAALDRASASRNATSARYRTATRSAVNGLQGGCSAHFASLNIPVAGGGSGPTRSLGTALAGGLDHVYYYDELGVEGGLTFSQATGYDEVSNHAVSHYRPSPNDQAFTLSFNGIALPHIVLASTFGSLSTAQQSALLVHELIHVLLPDLNELQVAQFLGLSDQLIGLPGGPSVGITQFILGACEGKR